MNSADATANPATTVGEVMTKELVTLKVDDTLRLAGDMLNLAHIRHFPVIESNRVAGVINQSDLLHASMASLIRHPQDSPRTALATVVVKDVMKPATTISPEVSVRRAAEIMVEHGVECLLVMGDEKLLGLVSRTDLLRELAKP
jgi:CBS domain-containing protein